MCRAIRVGEGWIVVHEGRTYDMAGVEGYEPLAGAERVQAVLRGDLEAHRTGVLYFNELGREITP